MRHVIYMYDIIILGCDNMTNEEITIAIQEIVDEIQRQSFIGTDEEIKIQQIMYFDKYVKDNIDYGFDAVNFSLEHPNENNPFNNAFSLEGFFEENELNGKRLAVCGSISQVAKIVFNKLGIECDYVWGHFNIGTDMEPKYVGHRWNFVRIGNMNYMVDFTAEMIAHNFNKDRDYEIVARQLLALNEKSGEFDYLFFDKLAPTESIGGFKKNENGTTVDDLDEHGFLNNLTTEPQSVIDNLGKIPKEQVIGYSEIISHGVIR